MTEQSAVAGQGAERRVRAYIDAGMARIDGWLTSLDAGMVAAVDAHQRAQGLTGSVGEIGIHHGRMFLLLVLGLQRGERAFAIDVFADQALNLDRSGRGEEAIFRANLSRYGVGVEQVAVFRQDSRTLQWREILAHVGQPARLVSVDGSHLAEVVEHDLGVMADGLAEHGVIVLDDYFSVEFPGVSEGASRFLLQQAGSIVPFAMGDSRLLLCRPAWVGPYQAAIAASEAQGYRVKEAALWGATIDIFRTPTRLMHHIRRSRVARAMRDHPLGLKLKPIVRRLLGD